MNASREYHGIRLKRLPTAGLHAAREQRYWDRLKEPVYVRHPTAVTSVHFRPNAPHSLAATASTMVTIYEQRSVTVAKRIARFKDTAYAGSFRGDGQLLAAGGATGMVQVFEAASRSILRQFKKSTGGHTQPVQALAWAGGADRVTTGLASGSDDKTIKLWDLGEASAPTVTLTGHDDYVRALCSLGGPHTFGSGSYDRSVRCWDMRSGQSVLSVDHGWPVEAVICSANGAVLVSAGGPVVKVTAAAASVSRGQMWDVAAGGRLLHSCSHHQKAVSCLCMDGSSGRLLSGSLDGFVKMVDMQDYQVRYSLKMSAPVLAVGMAPDNQCLAVGLADGTLAVR